MIEGMDKVKIDSRQKTGKLCEEPLNWAMRHDARLRDASTTSGAVFLYT